MRGQESKAVDQYNEAKSVLSQNNEALGFPRDVRPKAGSGVATVDSETILHCLKNVVEILNC